MPNILASRQILIGSCLMCTDVYLSTKSRTLSLLSSRFHLAISRKFRGESPLFCAQSLHVLASLPPFFHISPPPYISLEDGASLLPSASALHEKNPMSLPRVEPPIHPRLLSTAAPKASGLPTALPMLKQMGEMPSLFLPLCQALPHTRFIRPCLLEKPHVELLSSLMTQTGVHSTADQTTCCSLHISFSAGCLSANIFPLCTCPSVLSIACFLV